MKIVGQEVSRTCYKSEKRGNPVGFVRGLLKSQHLLEGRIS